jgi:hypothetical protein
MYPLPPRGMEAVSQRVPSALYKDLTSRGVCVCERVSMGVSVCIRVCHTLYTISYAKPCTTLRLILSLTAVWRTLWAPLGRAAGTVSGAERSPCPSPPSPLVCCAFYAQPAREQKKRRYEGGKKRREEKGRGERKNCD